MHASFQVRPQKGVFGNYTSFNTKFNDALLYVQITLSLRSVSLSNGKSQQPHITSRPKRAESSRFRAKAWHSAIFVVVLDVVGARRNGLPAHPQKKHPRSNIDTRLKKTIF